MGKGMAMDIEQQRWAPLSSACVATPGGFGWSQPYITDPPWWDDMEVQGHRFLFHAIYKSNGVAGAFINKSCTEYASYPDAWIPVTQNSDTITTYVNNGFDGKGGRLLDISVNTSDPQLPFNVILIPNYGPAARAWWWGHGATAQNLSDVIKGKAWGAFKADGVKKRLVSVKRYAQGNWTFMMVPWEPGVSWWWWPGKTWQEIGDFAKANNARIIDLERYGSSEDSFTVILVKNT
jgi:hypothetical protein